MTAVRDAIPADARAIASVHVSSWREGYRGLMPDDLLDGLSVGKRERVWQPMLGEEAAGARTIVAEVDTRVAGFATYALPSRDPDAAPGVGEVAALYVDPRQWRRGVGALLVRESIDRLRGDGAREVTVWVLDGNAGGMALYERAGFEPDGGRTAHEPSGRDQLRYRVRLTR